MLILKTPPLFKFNTNIKNILWDFDGVIMDSMSIRDKGFEIVLEDHPKDDVQRLMQYHRSNGGLSRYVKFRYFFEEVKNQQITEEEVNSYAQKFSQVMLKNLVDSNLLIQDALLFIKNNYQSYNMHVVSGSDQTELRHICRNLEIDKYFNSIHGSPTPKKKLVKDLLLENEYKTNETFLIGDSINDYEAAVENGISFYGYNNLKLKETSGNYIEKFS